MGGEKKDGRSAPRIPAGVMRVLCERLAARVDTAASMVEPGHFVACHFQTADRQLTRGETNHDG